MQWADLGYPQSRERNQPTLDPGPLLGVVQPSWVGKESARWSHIHHEYRTVTNNYRHCLAQAPTDRRSSSGEVWQQQLALAHPFATHTWWIYRVIRLRRKCLCMYCQRALMSLRFHLCNRTTYMRRQCYNARRLCRPRKWCR